MNIKENITAINQWPDRGIYKIEGIVIHSAWGTYQGSISWFKNPASKVSAHYVIKEDGEITKCVEEKAAAWHAGVVTTSLLKAPKLIKDRWGINPNLITVGVEYEDKRNNKWPYPKPQYTAGVELVADICTRYNINPDRGVIIMHRDIDPINRTDPVGMWDQDKFISDVKKVMGLPETSVGKRFVTVTAVGLNIREKPTTKSKKLGMYNYGDGIEVKESLVGELVSNNNLWWRTKDDTFISDIGCKEILLEKGGNNMTKEENEVKKAELAEKAAVIEARRVELEEATKANAADKAVYDEEYAAFVTEPVEEPVVEAVVEPVVEEPVKEEVATVVETPVDVAQDEKISKLEKMYEELKTLLGK